MTDLEISKRLAIAIGWPMLFCTGGCVMVSCAANWRVFDYTDWSVAGPIAEKYNAFPYQHKVNGIPDGKWVVWPDTLESTPQKAIAVSVINAMKETP